MVIPVSITAMEAPGAIKTLIVMAPSTTAGWCGAMAVANAAAHISATEMGRGISDLSDRETDTRDQDNHDLTHHRTLLLF
jgi:hypothetical protein